MIIPLSAASDGLLARGVSITMATRGLIEPFNDMDLFSPDDNRGDELSRDYDIDGRRKRIRKEDDAILKFITDVVTKRLME